MLQHNINDVAQNRQNERDRHKPQTNYQTNIDVSTRIELTLNSIEVDKLDKIYDC
jgi:uncharacterized membrane protein